MCMLTLEKPLWKVFKSWRASSKFTPTLVKGETVLWQTSVC